MSIYVRVLLVIGAVALLFFMLRKIRYSKLKIEYTIFWIIFSVILVFMGIFPGIITRLATCLGFQSAVNMVFLVIIFILIVKLFFNTIQISALENKIDNLVQQIGINQKLDSDIKYHKCTKESLRSK